MHFEQDLEHSKFSINNSFFDKDDDDGDDDDTGLEATE